MSIYNPYSRRAFLQGLGGSALSIPVLPSLFLPSRAEAQALAPLKYLQVFSILGRDMNQWYPTQLPSTSYKGMTDVYSLPLSSISGPLSKTLGTSFDSVRSKLSILRGLDAMMKVKQPNGSLSLSTHHNISVPSTGVPGEQIDFGNVFLATYGYSVDAVLEENTKIIPANAPFKALRLYPHVRDWRNQVENPEGYGSFCWTSKSGRTQMLPADSNLQNVFNKWFKNLNTNPGPTPVAQDPALVRRKYITDLVLGDYKKVQSSRRISSDDKYRLDNYIALVNDIEMRLAAQLDGGSQSGGGQPAAQCASPSVPASFSSASLLHQTAADLVVAAFACGLTRVASHVIHHFHDDPLKSYYDYAHAAAHEHNSNWPLMSIFRAQRFSDILTRLDRVKDTDGATLLDNTIVMFNCDESDGAHVFKDLPVLVAGGTRVLNQGNYIDYRPRPLVSSNGEQGFSFGRPLNQLMVTIFQAMGLSASEYQKLGATGFATYESANPDRYAPYTALAARNNPLPLLFKGA